MAASDHVRTLGAHERSLVCVREPRRSAHRERGWGLRSRVSGRFGSGVGPCDWGVPADAEGAHALGLVGVCDPRWSAHRQGVCGRIGSGVGLCDWGVPADAVGAHASCLVGVRDPRRSAHRQRVADRSVRVWDLRRESACGRWRDTRSCSVGVRAPTVGIVSGCAGKLVRVWDLASGKCLLTLVHPPSIWSVCVTPAGRHIVVSGSSGEEGEEKKTIRVWDLATGECVQEVECEDAFSVCVTPDGRHIVTGSYDRLVRVWDLATGECLRTLKGHTDRVSSVCVTPDGRHIVSGSEDKSVRVWGHISP